MKIKCLTVKLPYRYLWLKHVTGVDLSQHCARCLCGDYAPEVRRWRHEYKDIVLDDRYIAHYLCGVLNYENNLHCAIMRKDGVNTEAHDYKYDIEIEGGIIVPISPASIPPDIPHAKTKAFCTCRNWQFANWLKAEKLV